jgi:hypothetical protein
MLIELDIQLPATRKEALKYAMSIIDEMCIGNINVIDGTRDIIENVLYKYGFYEETKMYCFDSIGFEKAYGIYCNHGDLVDADYDWQPGKSNRELMTEVENRLLDELKIWKTRINVE